MNNKYLKRILKILLWGAGIIISLAIVFVILVNITPIPTSLVIRKIFDKSPATKPSNYENFYNKVHVVKNLEYPSKYKDNKADLYLPKTGDSFPIIIWVHGGGFVGGDKTDTKEYATMLSSYGYAVLSINYQRAPELNYPNQLKQLEEAYNYLVSISSSYNIDISNLFFAGDSAGAHLVAQFSLIQTSTEYANKINFNQVVPKKDIKGLLLYCGPFNVSKISEIKNRYISFIFSQAAWAYFGNKNWEKLYGDITTIKNHVTKDYPPVFITDGNTLSFEEHARELVTVLENKEIFVSSYFIPKEIKAIHEYQFKLDTDIGMKSLDLTLEFLEQYKK